MAYTCHMFHPNDITDRLIPEEEVGPGRVSEFRARELAAELGHEPVTHAQFAAFSRVGLIGPRGEDGRYSERIVPQLIAIKRAGRLVRPLARRVVFLRADDRLFPVASDKLLAALADLAPTIDQPARKLGRMARWGQPAGAGQPAGQPPAVKEWPGLFSAADPARVDAWATGWYATARVIAVYYDPSPGPLDDIPLEEQVLLLGVLDLARRAERPRQAAGTGGAAPRATHKRAPRGA